MPRFASLTVTLGCLLVLAGCGKPKPKYRVAPLEEPTATEETTDKAEESPTTEARTDGQTTSANGGAGTSEASPPAEPEAPPSPRPSILVKVMTDPLQDALQSNMAALQAVIGAVTKQAGIAPPPSATPKPAEQKPTDAATGNATQPGEDAKPPADAPTAPN